MTPEQATDKVYAATGVLLGTDKAPHIASYMTVMETRIAELEAKVTETRRAGLEEAVKWHEERALKLSQEASLARNFRQLLGKSDFHLCSAAAIRALMEKKDG
jgi:hypothetical protein